MGHMFKTTPIVKEIKHFHLFAGLGGGAKGFNMARPEFMRVGNYTAQFRCIGGVDVSAPAINDFNKLSNVPGTVLDLFSKEQYFNFFGEMPPPGWREATTFDIQCAAGGESPDVIFLSSPCKGFSGLLSENRSKTNKYQALNALTVRGVWLALESFKENPASLIVFENVPRITNRGRHLLDQIMALLTEYGYAARETTHNCGEIGGLAQNRKRFLLIARHKEKVPPFLYEPAKRNLRSVGSLLERMPAAGAAEAGPMHRVPNLQWQTWVRLAFVEAGSDWRSLKRLRVKDGVLEDYMIVPQRRNGVLGAGDWNDPSCTIAGSARPYNNQYSVADPTFVGSDRWNDGQQYGVRALHQTAPTISGQSKPGGGAYSVADPRAGVASTKHNNCFKVVKPSGPSGTVTGGLGPSCGGLAVADPVPNNSRQFSNIYRVTKYGDSSGTIIGRQQPSDGALSVADPVQNNNRQFSNIYRVNAFDAASPTVIGAVSPHDGALSVADPRPAGWGNQRDAYNTGGHYGVVPWDAPSGVISSGKQCHAGPFSVQDRRLPAPNEKGVSVIMAEDGTWHRPFTTLEMAVIQSLVEPDEYLELDGVSDAQWRERIGNAVPPKAAQAIAETMGRTLLCAWTGGTVLISSTPIWVQPVAVALAVDTPDFSLLEQPSASAVLV